MKKSQATEVIDLLWLIEAGKEEIDFYLAERSDDMFIKDVLALKTKLTDKSEVQRIIDNLQKLL